MGTSVAQHRGSTHLRAAALVLFSALGVGGLADAGHAAAATGSSATGTWSVVQSTPPVYSDLRELTCPSTTTCFAVADTDVSFGMVIGTTDDGAHWSPRYVPSAKVSVGSLFCRSATQCAATLEGPATGGLALTVDGTHWSVSRLPGIGGSEPGTVWCASPSTCVAVLALSSIAQTRLRTYVTSDGGSTWASATADVEGQPTSDLACTSPTTCLLGIGSVGSFHLDRTTDGGATWTSITLPHEMVTSPQVACTWRDRCIAAANGYLYASTTSGYAWTELHHGQDWLSPIAAQCNRTGACAVTLGARPGHDLLGLTANGGATWTLRSFGNDVAGLTTACANADSCLAATAHDSGVATVPTIYATLDGGARWQARFASTGITSLDAVDCPTTSACLVTGADATGGYAEASSTSGATWRAGPTVTGTVGVPSVSCLTASTCYGVAVDQDGFGGLDVTHDAGQRWARVALPGDAAAFMVTCTSATTCFAFSYFELLVTSNAGSSWAEATLPTGFNPGGGNVLSVACPTTSHCIASGGTNAGTEFLASTDGGRVWRATQTVKGIVWEGAVTSCTTTEDCLTLGQALNDLYYTTSPQLYATTDGGTTWTVVSTLGSYAAVADLSCTGDGTCQAIASTATTTSLITSRDTGVHWTASAIPLTVVNALFCRSADACVAIGGTSSGAPAIARRT